MSIWGILGVLIVLLGGLAAMVKYLRGAEANRAALSERNAELDLEQERVRQMEAAAADAMKARREKIREQAARVRGADDAARLLREVTGADDPNVN